jgi:hypothetical protein
MVLEKKTSRERGVGKPLSALPAAEDELSCPTPLRARRAGGLGWIRGAEWIVS